MVAGCWSAVPAARDPLLEAVELHGARSEAAPWAPHYRHTTPETAARAIDGIQQRLMVVIQVAEGEPEHHSNRSALKEF